MQPLDSRRDFLRLTGSIGSGLIVLGATRFASAQETMEAEADDDQEMMAEAKESETQPAEAEEREAQKGEERIAVPAAEDLMREHGVLRRVLLVYADAVDRMDSNREMPMEELHRSADGVRRFVNDYHEKMEEEHVFPQLERAGKYESIVRTLRDQHEASRRMTNDILKITESGARESADRRRLQTMLCAYIRMYEPHAAWEDTVIFPTLHKIMTPADYRTMGERFEEAEHKRFGENGFEKMVDTVASIEKTLGLYDLAQFTPARTLQGEPVGEQ